MGVGWAAGIGEGAGGVLFLGRSMKADAASDFFAPSGRAMPPLIPIRIAERPASPEWSALSDIDWRHPLLAPLQDNTFGDLLQVRASAWRTLEWERAPESARVLARTADGTPWLLEAEAGRGRIVVLNTSANDAWTDLPRRRIFVPLLDRITRFAAGSLYADAQPTVDTPLRIPLREPEAPTEVTVRDPEGKDLPIQLRPAAGGWEVQVDEARQPGVHVLAYRRAGERVERMIPVQTGRRDSAWSPADPTLAQRWWKPATFETVAGADWERQEESGPARFELDALLMILAVLLLGMEFFWAHWVCPRIEARVASGEAPSESFTDLLPEVIPAGLPEVLTGVEESAPEPPRKEAP